MQITREMALAAEAKGINWRRWHYEPPSAELLTDLGFPPRQTSAATKAPTVGPQMQIAQALLGDMRKLRSKKDRTPGPLERAVAEGKLPSSPSSKVETPAEPGPQTKLARELGEKMRAEREAREWEESGWGPAPRERVQASGWQPRWKGARSRADEAFDKAVAEAMDGDDDEFSLAPKESDTDFDRAVAAELEAIV